ncbi:MAG TPA: T9SS type A sorting domain-containing protein [Bacteroidales bacterium]|nr:T9SS type A sorting domain-containing protein [Bacteroidales bacterium]
MKRLALSIMAIFLCILLKAQSANSASGGNATGTGGSVSYTVGQVVYTTNTGTNGSAAQGVQQPYEISVEAGIKEALGILLEIVAYPNPTTDFIKLKIENYEVVNLRYQIFDINGNLLLSNIIDNKENNISMQNLMPATYFLKVIQGNKNVKTFKIIKK